MFVDSREACTGKIRYVQGEAGGTRKTEIRRGKAMSATLDYSGSILKSGIRLWNVIRKSSFSLGVVLISRVYLVNLSSVSIR